MNVLCLCIHALLGGEQLIHDKRLGLLSQLHEVGLISETLSSFVNGT
jgi:hypothetical protein